MHEIWDIYDIEPIKDSLENIEKISDSLSKGLNDFRSKF